MESISGSQLSGLQGIRGNAPAMRNPFPARAEEMKKRHTGTRDVDALPKKGEKPGPTATPTTGDSDPCKVSNPATTDESIAYFLHDRPLLTLVSEDGKSYGDSVLIKSDAETLTIKKPVGFGDRSTGTLKLYFQNRQKAWCFFDTEILRNNSHTICTTSPDLLYPLRRRKFQRISAPENSTVYFYQDNRIHYGGVVKNLSQSGMLICNRYTEEKLPKDSTLSEISIALPYESSLKPESKDGKPRLYIISKGRVVRSYLDPETKRVCHGITFEENHILREGLKSLTTDVKTQRETS